MLLLTQEHSVDAEEMVFKYWTERQAMTAEEAVERVREMQTKAAQHQRAMRAAAAQQRVAPAPQPAPSVPSKDLYEHAEHDVRGARATYDALDDWDAWVARVERIERHSPDSLAVHLAFKDGVRLVYPASVANRRCPQALLAFYERHVVYPLP